MATFAIFRSLFTFAAAGPHLGAPGYQMPTAPCTVLTETDAAVALGHGLVASKSYRSVLVFNVSVSRKPGLLGIRCRTGGQNIENQIFLTFEFFCFS